MVENSVASADLNNNTTEMDEKCKKKLRFLTEDTLISMKNIPETTDNKLPRCHYKCIDVMANFIEANLNCQPTYTVIKCTIVSLSIIQLCIFLVTMMTFKNEEEFELYPRHGNYFDVGLHVATFNAVLTTFFNLYAVIGEIWLLVITMSNLQAIYAILELIALIMEPIKVQPIYFVFIILTSIHTMMMLMFVVMLKLKKLTRKSSVNV